jgi:hypothetical protein
MAHSKSSFYKNLTIITAVALIALLYFLLDARKHPFPKCPFFYFTHLYCPGCGSQRALSALLHGQLQDAIHDNVLMICFLPLLSYWFLANFFSNGRNTASIFYNPFFGKAVLVTVVFFWVIRNIPFYPFSILSPLN